MCGRVSLLPIRTADESATEFAPWENLGSPAALDAFFVLKRTAVLQALLHQPPKGLSHCQSQATRNGTRNHSQAQPYRECQVQKDTRHGRQPKHQSPPQKRMNLPRCSRHVPRSSSALVALAAPLPHTAASLKAMVGIQSQRASASCWQRPHSYLSKPWGGHTSGC